MKKFEVIEEAGDWVVLHEGVELARYHQQGLALEDAARRLSQEDVGEAGASFTVRYAQR